MKRFISRLFSLEFDTRALTSQIQQPSPHVLSTCVLLVAMSLFQQRKVSEEN
jgi:hypothetical protein